MKIPDNIKQIILKQIEATMSVLGLKDIDYLFNKICSSDRKFPYYSDYIFKHIIDACFGSNNMKDLVYLDLGAGYALNMLDGLQKGLNVYGIEPSPNSFEGRYYVALELMKESGISNPEQRLFNCSGEDMYNIPDNFVDVIYSYQVLEHVQDIDRVLSEVKRVLKLNGVAYFTMPNYNSLYEGHYEILWIPYILSGSKKLAKIYLKLIKRNPSYIYELNFTTPSRIQKKAERIFGRDNVYTLPYGIRYIGFLNKYIYALGIFNFYLRLKIRGETNTANYLKKHYPYIEKVIRHENKTYLKLLSYITSMALTIFEAFITDFRLIIIRRS